MTNNKVVVTRVTKNQFERIKINAQAKGFKSISDYLRALALEKDIVFEKKFDDIYNMIVNSNSNERKFKDKNNEIH